MKTELLIVKDINGYIRFTHSSFHHCEMNQASVFPLAQLDEVKQKLRALAASGNTKAKIYLLTITEEIFIG